MGKDLKGRELGAGICQRKDGLCTARFVSKRTGKPVTHIQRSMEYRYSVGEWRIGEPKSKSGYRDVPLTEEAIAILKRQKEKINAVICVVKI